MTPPAEIDRTEILHQLERQHDRLLAALTELDERIDAVLRNARGDGGPGAKGD